MFDDGSFVHGVNKSNPFETILSYHVLLYNKSYPIKQSQTLPIEIEVIIVFLVLFYMEKLDMDNKNRERHFEGMIFPLMVICLLIWKAFEALRMKILFSKNINVS